MNQIVLAVLAAVVLIGAALFASVRADRRRESRQQRLRGVVAMGPSEEAPTLSLRWPLTRAGISDLFLLSKLWVQLEAAFAAAGNRIGLPQLTVTGLAVTGMTVLFAKKIMGFNSALVICSAPLRQWPLPRCCCASSRAVTRINFSTRSPMPSI